MNNNEVKILVDGEQLDLMENTDLKLSKNFTGTEESFSYDFEIPATTNNQRILGFLGKLHVANKFLNNLSATLYVNDTELFTGNLYVDSANSSTYSCNLIGAKLIEVSELLSDDYDKPLNELKPEPYKHFLINPIKYIPTKGGEGKYKVNGRSYSGFNAEFINSYNPNVEDKDLGYIYPLALYGKPLLYLTGESDEDFNVNSEDFFKNRLIGAKDSRKAATIVSDAPGYIFPFFSIEDIVKAIFYDRLGNDVKFEGNFFNSPIFKHLYQSFQGTYKDYYERDNQRFKISLSMNYDTIKDNSSIIPAYGTEAFPWSINDTDGEIYFFSTDLCKIQGDNDVASSFLPKFKVDAKHCPNGIVNPIDYDSNGIVSGISIKKSGWYIINTDVTVAYKGDRNIVYSHYLNSNKFRSCCGNIFNKATPYPDGYNPYRTLDAVSFYTNIWEFQIVKKDSKNTIYSNFSKQKYIDGDDFLYYPDNFSNISGGSFSFSNTLRIKNTAMFKARYPHNSNTFFVDNDDLVCGFRVGNQYSNVGLYNTYYQTLIGEFGQNYYGDINRNKIGDYLNIPLFGTLGQSGVSEWKFDTSLEKPSPVMKETSNNISSYEGFVITRSNLNNIVVLPDNGIIERFGLWNTYGSNVNTFRTYGHFTNINLLRSNKSFSRNNLATKNLYYVDDESKLYYSNVSYNDHNYLNNKELSFKGEITSKYCADPYYVNVYNPVSNEGESATITSSNLVYLKQGDELDLRLISPVINISPNCIPEGLKGKQLPVNYSIDIKELSFEYIGENNDTFVPGDDNLVNNSEETNTTFPTYFTQYLDDTKSSDWIENLAKLFKLEIKVDSLNKLVTINYNTSNNNFDIVDLSDYVNLDDIKSNNPITFTELEKPKSIIINWNRDGVDENRELKNGWDIILDKAVSPFNYYKDKEFNIKDGVLNLNGREESEIVDTSYGFPEMAKIRVNSKLNDIPYDIPLVTSYNDWHNTYLNTSDSYVANGLDNSRLYFAKSISNSNGQSLGIRLLENYDKDFRLPLMTTEKFGIDLKNLNTIIENFYNVDSSSEYIELQAFLPYRIYNSLSRDVLVKIDNSLFKLAKIDEYNVTGDKSCKLTVSPLG